MEFRVDKFYSESTIFRDDSIGGKVEMIAVPFLEGGHICKSLAQAQSIVNHLKSLHKANFVHGDIRGLNMVFSNNSNEAQFIDFDFGGKLGEVRFPPGYKKYLGDGRREGATATGQIEFTHDTAALVYVLAFEHGVSTSSSTEILSLFYCLQRAETLGTIEECLEELKKLEPDMEFEANNDYKNYVGTVLSTERPAVTPEKTVVHHGVEKKQKV